MKIKFALNTPRPKGSCLRKIAFLRQQLPLGRGAGQKLL